MTCKKMAKTKSKSKLWKECEIIKNKIVCKYFGLKMFKNISKFYKHFTEIEKRLEKGLQNEKYF